MCLNPIHITANHNTELLSPQQLVTLLTATSEKDNFNNVTYTASRFLKCNYYFGLNDSQPVGMRRYFHYKLCSGDTYKMQNRLTYARYLLGHIKSDAVNTLVATEQLSSVEPDTISRLVIALHPGRDFLFNQSLAMQYCYHLIFTKALHLM